MTPVPPTTYLDGVRGATALIEHGYAEKIVMARRVLGQIHALDDIRVPLSRLANRYTDCWTYAVDGMIGASPETLIRQIDSQITGRVLAGTRGRREDPQADRRERDELLANAKEQHEHDFAVQSVVTALAPHVDELRTSEQPFALELPNVWHLATDIEAVPSDGGSSLELAAALHPHRGCRGNANPGCGRGNRSARAIRPRAIRRRNRLDRRGRRRRMGDCITLRPTRSARRRLPIGHGIRGWRHRRG